MDLPQPDDLTSLVLRTDFSSEAAWKTVQAAIDGSGYRNATFVSDSSFTDVSVQALVDADAAADDDDKLCYVFLADATTMKAPDAGAHPGSSASARPWAWHCPVRSSHHALRHGWNRHRPSEMTSTLPSLRRTAVSSSMK
jgi:hypothetical protein